MTSRLLFAGYDHHGMTLDLYGTLDDDGYSVLSVFIHGTQVDMTECVSGDLLSFMSAKLDDTMPSAAELLSEAMQQDRAERAEHDRSMW